MTGESWLQAIRALGARRLRTLLTLLGIIIASGSLVLLVALAQDRVLQARDDAEGRRVCVIGHSVWRQLLREAPLDGQSLRITGERWLVVGVLPDKPLVIEPWALGVGLAASVLTGIVFGLYPALRAPGST